jgi:hypothetical protein
LPDVDGAAAFEVGALLPGPPAAPLFPAAGWPTAAAAASTALTIAGDTPFAGATAGIVVAEVGDGAAASVAVTVGLLVGVPVAMAVGDAAAVGLAVGEAAGVGLLVGGAGVGLTVGDAAGVGLTVGDAAGVGLTVGEADGVTVAVGVGVASHTALLTPFVSSVTAPLRAYRPPFESAPVFSVMDVTARMLPWKLVLVPSVALLPTCQKILHA